MTLGPMRTARRGSWAWRIAVLALAPFLLGAWARAEGPSEVGEAVLTPGEGGSATAFSLELPDGASCPGDSANDGYRVQSYMVPASVDPTTVTYDGTGPIPYEYGTYADFRQPLYDVDSNSFVSAQTADATVPGGPGPIINIPAFDYAVYHPGDLPAGRYHIGIACTVLNEITTVWDTQVVVAESADDQPAQIRWTAGVAEGGPADSGSGSNLPVATIVTGAVAVVAGLALRSRRHPQPTTTSLEDA